LSEIFIPKLQDRVWIDCIKQVAEKLVSYGPSATFTHLSGISISITSSDWRNCLDSLNSIEKSDSYLINYISFKAKNFSFVLYRGGQKAPNQLLLMKSL